MLAFWHFHKYWIDNSRRGRAFEFTDSKVFVRDDAIEKLWQRLQFTLYLLPGSSKTESGLRWGTRPGTKDMSYLGFYCIIKYPK